MIGQGWPHFGSTGLGSLVFVLDPRLLVSELTLKLKLPVLNIGPRASRSCGSRALSPTRRAPMTPLPPDPEARASKFWQYELQLHSYLEHPRPWHVTTPSSYRWRSRTSERPLERPSPLPRHPATSLILFPTSVSTSPRLAAPSPSSSFRTFPAPFPFVARRFPPTHLADDDLRPPSTPHPRVPPSVVEKPRPPLGPMLLAARSESLAAAETASVSSWRLPPGLHRK